MANLSSSLSLAYAMLDLHLRIRREMSPGLRVLGLSETHVLGIILDGAGQSSAIQISQILGLEKSSVSRLLLGLESRGLITQESRKGQGKKKFLYITEAGRRALEDDDKARSSISERITKHLRPIEQGRLESLLGRIADGLDAPAGAARESEHPLRLQQRRLNIVLGLLSGKMLGTDFNPTELHILRALSDPSLESDLTALAASLPFDLSTVSRAVKSLGQRGLIQRRAQSLDRRRITLSLTNAGRAEFREAQGSMAELLGKALRSINAEELKSALELISSVSGRSVGGGVKLSFGEISHLITEESRSTARAFLVSEAVKRRQQGRLLPHLFVPEGMGFALHGEAGISAVCEFQPDGNKWRLVNFVCSEALSRRQTHDFLNAALAEFKRISRARRVVLPSL